MCDQSPTLNLCKSFWICSSFHAFALSLLYSFSVFPKFEAVPLLPSNGLVEYGYANSNLTTGRASMHADGRRL